MGICHFGHKRYNGYDIFMNIWICHFGRKDIHLDVGWTFLLKQCFRSLCFKENEATNRYLPGLKDWEIIWSKQAQYT